MSASYLHVKVKVSIVNLDVLFVLFFSPITVFFLDYFLSLSLGNFSFSLPHYLFF